MAERGLKILVVDDDDVDRMAVRRALKASGLEASVTEAENAESALSRLAKEHFDCTLLDYRMPGSDGLDVVRLARDKGILVPFIMLTGFGDEQTAVELMKAGAADYIPKSSLTPERLAVSLRGVLRIHQAEIEASRAEGDLRRYADQLGAVAQAAIDINSTLAVDAMLQSTTENARRILNARYAETRLDVDTTASSGSLEAQTAMWRASAPSEEDQELTSWADATRDEMPGITPEILAMLAENPDAVDLGKTGFHVPNTLTVDLIGRTGKRLGAIQLWDKKDNMEFDDADKAILTQLSSLAAVALENARLFRAAQDATRARDDLVAIVSHDLRNPVHTISMAASFLLEIAPANDRRVQARRQLEVIQRSATRANRLIQDLLDVAKIQAGGLAVDPVAVEVKTLVNEVMDSATTLASAAQIKVTSDFNDPLPSVASDRERVLQVFTNLIGNAIKFTPKGGSITIRATEESGEVRFTIADTGPGIPREHLDHVFDRYWQAKSTAKLGTGLGLSIAKGIVEAHGGRIWAESPPGRGAEFNFTLPVA
ncbi:MAG TPA: ATP-binding protein [Gemmatimonadaceae bacterium]|nr:ATP-binding protein [Gemmatimonadaceae bacterium]